MTVKLGDLSPLCFIKGLKRWLVFQVGEIFLCFSRKGVEGSQGVYDLRSDAHRHLSNINQKTIPICIRGA